jgi:acetyl-CoA acetyltransferase
MAALQARAMLDAGLCTERDMADIAVRSRRDAKSNPNAQLAGDFDPEVLLGEPCIASPLRKHDCAPITDGAAAIVLAAGDLARRVSTRPAWVRGIDHRIEAHHIGMRELTASPSTAAAARNAGAAGKTIDVAELYAPFTHQEIILRRAIGLNGETAINPSGGALAANPMMAAGLIRIGEAATRLMNGEARTAVAHATSGPCLQQNLVCLMEAV